MDRLKRKIGICLVTVFFSFFPLIPILSANAAPVVLKFSDINAQRSAAGVFCEKFKELTEKKTEGRVKIEIYYGGTLTGNDIKGTQTGIAHFSQHNVTEALDLCKYLSILEMPFTYSTDEELYKITAPDSKVFQKINEAFAGSGVRLLTTYSWGPQNILTTKKPVYNENDLKGLKIRVLPSKVYMETMKAMGATPTPMSWGEVISSLVTGMIDGTGMPLCYVVPTGLHEIQKFYILTGHNPTLSGIFMNEAAWKKLSDEDQKNLLAAGDEARYAVTKYIDENNEAYKQEMLKKGMTIISADQLGFDTAKIKETVYNLYKDDWGDVYEEVQKILAK